MAVYKVVEVVSARDLKKFIKFPNDLYKDCPQYVPALFADQKKSLTAAPSLAYCTRKMWMVTDGALRKEKGAFRMVRHHK